MGYTHNKHLKTFNGILLGMSLLLGDLVACMEGKY
jgi:hypothetical protein